MGRKGQDVTPAELAILEILWDRATATIGQLTELLYPSHSDSDYSTVKKLLARLEAKGCVRRDRRRAAHWFEAAITREQLLDRRLQALGDTLYDGSQVPLLMHLLQTVRLTAKQRRELHELLDGLIESKGKRTNR